VSALRSIWSPKSKIGKVGGCLLSGKEEFKRLLNYWIREIADGTPLELSGRSVIAARRRRSLLGTAKRLFFVFIACDGAP